MVLNANTEAQDEVYKVLSAPDSSFCQRIHGMLEGAIVVFEKSRKSNQVHQPSIVAGQRLLAANN